MDNNEIKIIVDSFLSIINTAKMNNTETIGTYCLEQAVDIIQYQQEQIDALKWTNKQLLKNEKKKRKELWNKAKNYYNKG